MMDVKTLTRENVASHLQKYRLQLRRAGGYDQQARIMLSMYGRMQCHLDMARCKVQAARTNMDHHTIANSAYPRCAAG